MSCSKASMLPALAALTSDNSSVASPTLIASVGIRFRKLQLQNGPGGPACVRKSRLDIASGKHFTLGGGMLLRAIPEPRRAWPRRPKDTKAYSRKPKDTKATKEYAQDGPFVPLSDLALIGP